jgi:hypothetical protein
MLLLRQFTGSAGVTLAIWLLQAGSILAAEPSYCAYRVKVSDPQGAPVARVATVMVGVGGSVAEKLTDKNGAAEFCDAPLRPVDISVGFAGCGLVINKEVKPLWLRTRELFVTYDQRYCEEFGPFPGDCHIVFRVQDGMGRPVAGAIFEDRTPTDGKKGAVSSSDSFGRLFAAPKDGGGVAGMIVKDGYAAAAVSQSCSIRAPDADREVTVVLRTGK